MISFANITTFNNNYYRSDLNMGKSFPTLGTMDEVSLDRMITMT